MFDSRYAFKLLLNSEQAAAFVEVRPKALPQYVRTDLFAGLHVGKLCRFRASDLGHCLPHAVNSEQLSVPPHHS
jgi:hypothetical protein